MGAKTAETMLGIDFGESKISVAVFDRGHVRMIESCEGTNSTPCCAFIFDKDCIVTGSEAREHAIRYPGGYASHFKTSLICRTWEEFSAHLKRSYMSVQLENSSEYALCTKEKTHTLRQSAKQLTVLLLRDVKRQAEYMLHQTITKCAVSLPDSWSKDQRKLMVQCLKSAGFQRSLTVSESFSALLGIYLRFTPDELETAVCKRIVVDIGYAESRVTVFKCNGVLQEEVFYMEAIKRGGSDIDRELLNYCAERFIEEHAFDFRSDQETCLRVLLCCEDGKKLFSSHRSGPVTIYVRDVYQGYALDCPISFSTFKNACEPTAAAIVEETTQKVKQYLVEPYEIYLVGGGSKVKIIQEMFRQRFSRHVNRELLSCPNEMTVSGAAGFALYNEQRLQSISSTAVVLLNRGGGNSEGSNRHSIMPLTNMAIKMGNFGSYLPDIGREKRPKSVRDAAVGPSNPVEAVVSSYTQTEVPVKSLLQYYNMADNANQLADSERSEINRLLMEFSQQGYNNRQLCSTELLGDLLKDCNVALAAKIYCAADCTMKALECFRECNDFEELVRYLVEKNDPDWWAKVLHGENPDRVTIIDHAVREAGKSDSAVKILMAFIESELWDEVEEIITAGHASRSGHNTTSDQENTLVILKAIKTDPTSLTSHAKNLHPDDGPLVAKVVSSYGLQEEAFCILQSLKLNVLAVELLTSDLKDFARAKKFASTCNQADVWSALGAIQLKHGMVGDCVRSYVEAVDPKDYENVVRHAREQDNWDGLVEYLIMVYDKYRNQFAYDYMIVALGKTNRLSELTEIKMDLEQRHTRNAKPSKVAGSQGSQQGQRIDRRDPRRSN
ncbi:putative Clathrin heavy chain 1 [Hypsibius exemplaris]|uniref:Clathrin heavy chain 1 n=1 Tax=Hypsibius exemplaris TaxID=2072580 RepID=A0A9X6RNG5_HYPEX|nr:putative Clathrin heavy chain 1 [Hypsibius exemplaris]